MKTKTARELLAGPHPDIDDRSLFAALATVCRDGKEGRIHPHKAWRVVDAVWKMRRAADAVNNAIIAAQPDPVSE